MSYKGSRNKRLASVKDELLEFLGKNDKFFSKTFLSKAIRTKISYETAQSFLEELESEGKIKSIIVGGRKVYGK